MSATERRRIYLLGLMGSGKSTVGRCLAETLGCGYIDNDATIAKLAGSTTVALARAGGTLLHDWEARYADHLRQLPAPVVAGIPASAADRSEELQTLRHTGLLVYLRCDVDTLVRRITADAPRPWLTGDVRPTIEAMFQRRDPVLQAGCERTVDATLPPARIAELIMTDEPDAATPMLVPGSCSPSRPGT